MQTGQCLGHGAVDNDAPRICIKQIACAYGDRIYRIGAQPGQPCDLNADIAEMNHGHVADFTSIKAVLIDVVVNLEVDAVQHDIAILGRDSTTAQLKPAQQVQRTTR